jgi:hypothetical protein
MNHKEQDQIKYSEINKTTRNGKINVDGIEYDLEDGRVVNYISFYLPILKREVRIDACDFFKYIFGIF